MIYITKDIINEFEKLDWKFIEDEFTKQGRYHFQRYREFNFGKETLVNLDYVLIFNYNNQPTTMQTCRMCGEKKDIEPYVNETVYGYYETKGNVTLTTEELQLFLEFMLFLGKEKE